jgi:hypothetical protein
LKTALQLNLEGDIEEWNHFILSLKHSAIRIKDKEDEVIWARNKATGSYTVKLGYETRMEEEIEGENIRW